MKKVLFVATITRHINAFHIPYLKMFKENGYEVHVASNGEQNIEYCDKHYNIPFARSPLNLNNIKAYKELKKIINENKYEIIHCHTPVGGVLTRLAAKQARKQGTRVLYTAHGFHFYKGAPIKNWIMFYPIEKYLSKYTDILITINTEDYEFAKRKLKAKDIQMVHGVGLDTKKFDADISKNDIEKIKEQCKINEKTIVLTYVAEINKNKNQILLINAMENLCTKDNRYKLILVGDGTEKENCEKYVKEKGLEQNVIFLGKRNDIEQILSITSIYVASSLREGLPVNILEAMYMNLPVIAMDNRGHRALINNGANGFLINNCEELIKKIVLLSSNEELTKKFKEENKKIVKSYLLNNVKEEMKKIYKIGE